MAIRKRRAIVEDSEVFEDPTEAEEFSVDVEPLSVPQPNSEEVQVIDESKHVPLAIEVAEIREGSPETEKPEKTPPCTNKRTRPDPLPKRRPRRNSPRFSSRA